MRLSLFYERTACAHPDSCAARPSTHQLHSTPTSSCPPAYPSSQPCPGQSPEPPSTSCCPAQVPPSTPCPNQPSRNLPYPHPPHRHQSGFSRTPENRAQLHSGANKAPTALGLQTLLLIWRDPGSCCGGSAREGYVLQCWSRGAPTAGMKVLGLWVRQ